MQAVVAFTPLYMMRFSRNFECLAEYNKQMNQPLGLIIVMPDHGTVLGFVDNNDNNNHNIL